MHFHRRTYVMLGMLGVGLAAYIGDAPSEAADRSNRAIDSGKPRELINQPTCWPPEQIDDARHCEFAEKT